MAPLNTVPSPSKAWMLAATAGGVPHDLRRTGVGGEGAAGTRS